MKRIQLPLIGGKILNFENWHYFKIERGIFVQLNFKHFF